MTNRRAGTSERAWLSSEDAAELLGIKRATLYTYASRGWIRTASCGRQRRYLLEDVCALKRRADAAGGHAAAAASAMDFGAPILGSNITAITTSGPRYRGYDALALARDDTPFESVSVLLWDGGLPAVPPRFESDDLGLDRDLLRALGSSRAIERLLPAAIAVWRCAEPPGWNEPARLLRRISALAAVCFGEEQTLDRRICGALAADSVAHALAIAVSEEPPSAEVVRNINRALVLCADHELNASTFAARVAASTGADDGAVLLAAFGAFSGDRHGRASVPLASLVTSIVRGAPGDLAALLDGTGREPPGFGHRLYPDGDPRARLLLADAASLGSSDPRWFALLTLLDALRRRGASPPNLDAGLFGCICALSLPDDAARTLFAVGRVAGWLAHAREQRETGELLRPRAQRVLGR